MRGGSSRRAFAIRSVSQHAQEQTSCGSVMSAGTTGKKSTSLRTPRVTAVQNFGWPCYEGVNRQAGYDGANLSICENLYAIPREP